MNIINNAIIMPHVGNMDSFTEGVFTQDGTFIDDSKSYRGKRPIFCGEKKYLDETCIYGGCLYGHFGHFIWESLCRLSTIKKCNNFPIIFLSPNCEIHKSQQLFLRRLGVKNNLYLIKEPIKVRKLIYSSPFSSLEPLFIDDEQLKNLACIDTKAANNDNKIWLSRSKLTRGKVVNEAKIEDIIQKLGFEIIFPEELSIYKQIEIVSSSKYVAGFDGSQFFSFLLAKNIVGEFHIFNRRHTIAKTIPYALNKRNIKHQLYNFNVRLESGSVENAGANYTALEIDKIVDALEGITKLPA